MAFPEHLLENVVTAMISGGGTAVSAILAFFRDVKKRLEELEKKVGSIESRSGLMFQVSNIETAISSLRTEISSLAMNPPEWLVQAIRRRSPSFHNIDDSDHDRIRAVESKIKDLEEQLERLERKVNRCVSEEDFESADRNRAEDIATVRTAIAEVNGLLKGLQTALGLVKGGSR